MLAGMGRALGRYELLRPLARGGMAEVYLARRRAAGVEKLLVVKRIRPERSGDARFLEMFMREARLSMSLAHQNIVPVFDFGRIDDQVFLAMERIEGKDLGSSLARATDRRLSPLLAAFVAAECCQALDYAHHRKGPDGTALGVVHRDVTPRNVLLSWAGEVKLTDFGIAALAGDTTSKSLGTPQYMAPEQARGEPIDARADVYALGLVLRELLTGQRARPGTEREPILDAARAGQLVPWPADVTGPLVAITERATALAVADRYPDARAMLAALDGFIVGERAARQCEAPARQLATWLEVLWAGARDDGPIDGEIESGHLLSYVDDGMGAIGTGTERSMLGTAGDEDAIPALARRAGSAPVVAGYDDEDDGQDDEPSIIVRASARHQAVRLASEPGIPQRTSSGRIPAQRLASEPGIPSGPSTGRQPAQRLASEPGLVGQIARSNTRRELGVPGPEDGAPRGRMSPWMPVMLIASAVAGALVVVALRRADAPAPTPAAMPERAPEASTPVAVRPADVPRDPTNPGQPAPALGATVPVVPTQGTAVPPTPGAAVAPTQGAALTVSRTKPTRPVRPASGQPPAGAGAAGSGAGSAVTPPPIALRKVTINATPWAYFAVDDDPTQHETMKTLSLAPGRHRIRFSNPVLKVERQVTIEVPVDRDLTHVERLGN